MTQKQLTELIFDAEHKRLVDARGQSVEVTPVGRPIGMNVPLPVSNDPASSNYFNIQKFLDEVPTTYKPGRFTSRYIRSGLFAEELSANIESADAFEFSIARSQPYAIIGQGEEEGKVVPQPTASLQLYKINQH